MEKCNALVLAAAFSFIASLTHIAIVFGGPSWYRFFGAGEGMAQLAEQGSIQPTIVTLAIAAVLAIWGFYALSGAGVVFRLPLLKLVLVAITSVYLLRGVAGLILPFVSNHPALAQNSLSFWVISSILCCFIGVFHLAGTMSNWAQLSGMR